MKRSPYMLPVDFSLAENAVDNQTIRFPDAAITLEQLSISSVFTVVAGSPAGSVFATDQFSFQFQVDDQNPFQSVPIVLSAIKLLLPFPLLSPIHIPRQSALTIYVYNLVQNKSCEIQMLFNGYKEV